MQNDALQIKWDKRVKNDKNVGKVCSKCKNDKNFVNYTEYMSAHVLNVKQYYGVFFKK